jgi:hypothetical protein
MHHSLSKPRLRRICFASVAVISLATVGDALAQNCESMSGSRRTDCFIGRARILGLQSDIAAGTARLRAGEARLRAATGTGVQPRLRRTAKSEYKVRPK